MSFNVKALGAFKKLGAVALITATLAMFFTACNQTSGGNSGGGGESTPKHAITFGVEGGNGTLKAKAYGVAETTTSPINVEEGKTVTFTAEPSTNYKVKEWKVGDTVVTGNKTNTYTHTVKKAVTVKVSFEANSNPPNPPTPQGTAILTLDPNKLTIKVEAKTADGSAIKVEGCNVNELANEAETTLTVTNPERKLALIGDIIELDCSGEETPGGNRPLIALDVTGCTALQKLNCRFNFITELDVHGLKALQNLSCKNNKLTALNVQDCTALKELECDGNELTVLNVQGCTALQTLRCYDNRLTSLDVHGLRALKELECNDNLLTALNAQDCTALEKLHCRKNQLAVLNVQGCTALRGLDCLSNKLDAQAFTKLFSDLPQSIIYAYCYLYTDEKGVSEGNCKDFTSASAPVELKRAFEKVKNEKKWTMYKIRADKIMVEI